MMATSSVLLSSTFWIVDMCLRLWPMPPSTSSALARIAGSTAPLPMAICAICSNCCSSAACAGSMAAGGQDGANCLAGEDDSK